MKIQIQTFATITITLIILGVASCKKESPEQPIDSIGVEQGYFVIGSQSFFDDFNMVLNREKSSSTDSSLIIHYFDLDSSFLHDIEISENRNMDPVLDSSYFSQGITIRIESKEMLTEIYEDYSLRTRNITKDTVSTTNKLSLLPSYEDTIRFEPFRFSTPRFFNVGDTVNWSVETRKTQVAHLFYFFRQRFGINEVEEQESINTDILGTNSKFIVVKYSWYPQDFDINNQYEEVLKYGVIEVSMNADSTIKIHNVYSQK